MIRFIQNRIGGANMSYVTGSVIKELREKKGYTQKQLADTLSISDKTVSKWETNRGLPDVGMIESLASALGVSITELLTGELAMNKNRAANMKKLKFYICPICGNIIQALGEGGYTCCGIALSAAEIEEEDGSHATQVESVENEYYLHMKHPMTKEHYISFAAYITSSHLELVKFYPEQEVVCRFLRKGHGYIYLYCNQHGLFRKTV